MLSCLFLASFKFPVLGNAAVRVTELIFFALNIILGIYLISTSGKII